MGEKLLRTDKLLTALEWDPSQVTSVVSESPTGGCPHLYRGFQYFWKFNGLFHTFSKILGYRFSLGSQSFLSSLLRYIQPYSYATITFSFRQFSLSLLYQSHSFTVMQFSALCSWQNRVNLAECRTDDPLGRTHLETKIAGLVWVALCSQS